MSPEGDVVFRDVNAPCPRAKVVQNWFASRYIALLQWPGQFSDLSTVENLRNTVGCEIWKKLSTKKELI